MSVLMLNYKQISQLITILRLQVESTRQKHPLLFFFHEKRITDV